MSIDYNQNLDDDIVPLLLGTSGIHHFEYLHIVEGLKSYAIIHHPL